MKAISPLNLAAICLLSSCFVAPRASSLDIAGLSKLSNLRSSAQNALWIENPSSAQFTSTNRVVVAQIKGPAEITMIHFAMPQTLALNRDCLLRIYWDGEQSPSVDCPLVDFFCDPAGLKAEVNTALVNKRRGFNSYFPMPFSGSARVELVYDGAVKPGDQLWRMMPCYSYVMYRALDKLEDDTGYFHACWRQDGLLLGKRDYAVMEAQGKGKFAGWNVTVRRPGTASYPVDENEKFYIDGEEAPSIEFQGLEDSFGFSWGFPESESMFPLTGYFPFLKGAAAYRFFVNDAIVFQRSLRVTIGFGKNEAPFFRQEFSKPGSELQLSSVAYWYQTEPHLPFKPMPEAIDRAPAPEDRFWPGKEQLPSVDELKKRRVRLYMACGRLDKEVVYAENGYGATAAQGYSWDGWSMPVYHARASDVAVLIELTVPAGAKGLVRLYVIDPDSFQGGRRQEISVDGKSLGVIEDFQNGRWLECRVGPDETADSKVAIKSTNARDGSNAVISIVEWVETE